MTTATITESTYLRQLSTVSVVYNIYRIVLPLVLLVTFISRPDLTLLGAFAPNLFVQICSVYAVFGVVIVFISPSGGGILLRPRYLVTALLVDIFAITLIVYSCGGVFSGLGLLLIVTIASGAILIRGRTSTFLAAVAVLSIIYSELYLTLVLDNPPNQFVQTGILGALLFIISLYIQSVTDRIYKTTELAEMQASSIVDLEKLNDEIIQRMRTGVMVINTDLEILSMNSAARHLLGPALETTEMESGSTDRLPVAIREQLELWKRNSKRQPQPIGFAETKRQIQINFAFLNPKIDSNVLVFLEDNRQIVQRVRQMKLASLGRLTASIAHEVRNPLGAISHASQLMTESETLGKEDRRMLEIVLEHCDRINMIIEDVLNVSRQEDSASQELLLETWLAKFISDYEDTHKTSDEILFQVLDKGTSVHVSKSQLEQVLNNLFDNGLRYSKKNTGRATLTVQVGRQIDSGDQQPYINVIDDGPGIDEESQGKLFEPFHTTEPTGTGLGLYISRELCEANQSQLTYRRTEAGKSCFTIYFTNPERTMT